MKTFAWVIASFLLLAGFAGETEARDNRRNDRVTLPPMERVAVRANDCPQGIDWPRCNNRGNGNWNNRNNNGRPVVVNNYYGNRGGYNGHRGNYGHGYNNGRVPSSVRDRALIGSFLGGLLGGYVGSSQQYPQQYPPQGYPCNGYNCGGQPMPMPQPMPYPPQQGYPQQGGNVQVTPIGVFNGQAIYQCPHGGFGTEQMCRAGQGSQQPPQGMQPVNGGGYPGGQPGYPGGYPSGQQQGCQIVNGYRICPSY